MQTKNDALAGESEMDHGRGLLREREREREEMTTGSRRFCPRPGRENEAKMPLTGVKRRGGGAVSRLGQPKGGYLASHLTFSIARDRGLNSRARLYNWKNPLAGD